jgi:hypothetical protein
MKQQKFELLINNIESHLQHFQNKNETISQVTIGWHMEHLLKVLINVTAVIKKSDPSDFKKSFNKIRTIIFLTGKIPRGKGKAPQSVLPSSNITIESLQNSFFEARKSIALLYSLDGDKHFIHPYFGNVKLKGCIKFLAIHSNHHYKIIQDINK